MRNKTIINKIRNKKIIFIFLSVYVLLLFWGCSSENKDKEDLNIESYEIDMNRAEIENYKKEVFLNYKHLDNLEMFSFVEKFADESEKEINKDLFYSFVQLYDNIKEENSSQNKSNSLKIPISRIYNEDLYNDYQTNSIPISLVQMEYTRHDEINEANICVRYTQLSRFLDPNIQLEINTKIKEYAFSQWNVETEREIELNILQTSFIYKNYLSVRNRTDYYSKAAIHPWQALSAMTFDLRTGNEVSLTDIIKVNDRLKAKIYAGDFEASRATHKQCIEMGYYDNLWDSILRNSKSPDKSQYFYLLDNKLGFILEVPHAMGDYITFEESLQGLEGLLQN